MGNIRGKMHGGGRSVTLDAWQVSTKVEQFGLAVNSWNQWNRGNKYCHHKQNRSRFFLFGGGALISLMTTEWDRVGDLIALPQSPVADRFTDLTICRFPRVIRFGWKGNSKHNSQLNGAVMKSTVIHSGSKHWQLKWWWMNKYLGLPWARTELIPSSSQTSTESTFRIENSKLCCSVGEVGVWRM